VLAVGCVEHPIPMLVVGGLVIKGNSDNILGGLYGSMSWTSLKEVAQLYVGHPCS